LHDKDQQPKDKQWLLRDDGEAKLLLLLHCGGDGTKSRGGWTDYLGVIATGLECEQMCGEFHG
jgi:hypothetical protein